MIEIKVDTRKINDDESVVRVEGCAKFSGKYSLFLEEIDGVLRFLDNNDHKAFNAALNNFMNDRICDHLKVSDESEDGDE